MGINDAGSMADRTPQGSDVLNWSDIQLVPSGPITRAHTKKLWESFQTLVWNVQMQVGVPSSNQGLEQDDSTLYTLIQVVDESEVSQSVIGL